MFFGSRVTTADFGLSTLHSSDKGAPVVMLALLTFFPTIVAVLVLGLSFSFGHPVELGQVGWLISEAQAVFLAIGAVAILLSRKSARPLPPWRAIANRWVGRVLATSAIFYLIAFALVTYYGP